MQNGRLATVLSTGYYYLQEPSSSFCITLQILLGSVKDIYVGILVTLYFGFDLKKKKNPKQTTVRS